jgi:hypothetical protein
LSTKSPRSGRGVPPRLRRTARSASSHPTASRMTSGSNCRHSEIGRKPKSPKGASSQPITGQLRSCNTSV